MDAIDRKIVDILEKDASIRNYELADRVGLAPSSCLRRVQRLKSSGVIHRIVAVTNPNVTGRAVRALVLLWLSDHSASVRRRMIAQFQQEPSVKELYSISGQADLAIMIAAPTMEAVQEFADRMLANDPLILRFETMFVLQDHTS